MNTIKEFDSSVFSATLYSLINEYNIADTSPLTSLQGIVIHLPKSWVDSTTVKIDLIKYDFATENTIEIEVDWQDPLTKEKINYTALSMKEC